MYIGLLSSRSVQDDVIRGANLMALYHFTSMETAREALAGKISIAEGGDTIVALSVRDGDAQTAALIANAYLVALQNVIDVMSVQPTSATTQFFEHQLESERAALTAAELQLEQTQKQTGLVNSEAQTSIGISTIAATRSQITQLQVQLSALLQSETEANPEVQRLRSQLAQLQAQEHVLETGGSSPVGAAPAAGQMPAVTLTVARAQREVSYHDSLVKALASQFEAAKLTEAFTRPAFQVVDRAIAPEHKAWPPRKPYFLGALLISALIGFAAVIVKILARRVLSDPGHRTQIASLRRAFSRR